MIGVTSSNDRWHRITRNHTNSEIQAVIGEHVHGRKNQAIARYLFIDGLTYEQAAEQKDVDMSPRGVYYRVDKIAPDMERHLN